MKTKWIILLLVLGLLFFGLGCLADSVAVEGIGAVALFPGLMGGDGEGLEGGGRGVIIGQWLAKVNTSKACRPVILGRTL